MKDCAAKKVLAVPLISNFDSYDGKADLSTWAFPFNGAAGDATTLYAGPYFSNDGTGAPVLGMVGGAGSSMWAIDIATGANMMATGWGGGLGFWMGCVDASSAKGLSFNVRGVSPTGKISVTLSMEDTSKPDATDAAGGGTCTGTTCKAPSVDVPITADWVLTQIPWSMFSTGTGLVDATVTANGDRINGLNFSVQMVYVQDPADATKYNPTPAADDLLVDGIGFYRERTAPAPLDRV
jgi:hypothetical protein